MASDAEKLKEISWIGFQKNLLYLGELLERDNTAPDILAVYQSLVAHAAILEQEALKNPHIVRPQSTQ